MPRPTTTICEQTITSIVSICRRALTTIVRPSKLDPNYAPAYALWPRLTRFLAFFRRDIARRGLGQDEGGGEPRSKKDEHLPEGHVRWRSLSCTTTGFLRERSRNSSAR